MKLIALLFLLVSLPTMAQLNCDYPIVNNNIVQTLDGVSSSCANVEPARYNFCRALKQGMCSLVTGDDYNFCQALKTGLCSLTTGNRYTFCQGLKQNLCSLIRDPRDYWLCVGIKQKSCATVAPPDYWFCRALTGQ